MNAPLHLRASDQLFTCNKSIVHFDGFKFQVQYLGYSTVFHLKVQRSVCICTQKHVQSSNQSTSNDQSIICPLSAIEII